MRVVFLAVDDEFAGAMQEALYRKASEQIVGSVLSTCVIYRRRRLAAALFVLRKSGLFFLIEMLRLKVLRLVFSKKSKVTPRTLAREHGVELFKCRDINDSDALARLESWHPDLVISTNFNHYIGRKARNVARIGTWNLHKSYLPMYRGMAPSFHALLNGADYTGATLHLVMKGFDTGDILRQVQIPIEPGDSVFSLNMKASVQGGEMLAELLAGKAPAAVAPKPQASGNWPSYTYPSRAEVRQFRKRGLSF